MSGLRTEVYHDYMKIIVIGMLMVTLCYPIFIETAAVPSERMALQDFENLRASRSLEESVDDPVYAKRNCYNMPCGWAVYHRSTRNVEYFMKNACECVNDSYKCIRVGDDLSASAYVYRCRPNVTADDILAGSEDMN